MTGHPERHHAVACILLDETGCEDTKIIINKAEIYHENEFIDKSIITAKLNRTFDGWYIDNNFVNKVSYDNFVNSIFGFYVFGFYVAKIRFLFDS